MKRLGALFVMVSAITAGTADAANYYVSPSGNDAFSCAQAQQISSPKRTIRGGLTCLSGGGDALFLRAGTYNEGIDGNNIPSGTNWSSVIRIANYNDETVTIKPDDAHAAGHWALRFGGDTGDPVVSRQYIVLDGIHIDGTLLTGGGPVNFDSRNGSNPNHIRLTNLRITGPTRTTGDTSGGIVAVGGTDNEFTNCEVTGNAGYGFYIAGNRNLVDGCDIHHTAALGIHIYHNGGNPVGNIVRNTRIHDITGPNLFFGTNDFRIGGILAHGDDHLIYNNLIYNIHISWGVPSPYGGIQFFSTGRNRRAYNNTIYDVEGAAFIVDANATASVIKNNIAYRNVGAVLVDFGSGTTQSSNLFGVDPAFVNPSANDFRLGNGSPAKDAGVVVSAVATDIVGTARPQGAAPDIGAFEYPDGQNLSPSPPSPPTNVRIVSSS